MTAFTKPFAAMWRARGYVFAGVVIYLLSFAPLPLKDADPHTLDWWQVAIGKAFGSLDKIAYAVLLAGLVYALLSDLFDFIWSSKLGDEFNQAVVKTGSIVQGGLNEFNQAVEKTGGIIQVGFDKFVAGLGTMSFEAIKVWVENGKAEGTQLRVVGSSSLKSYFGQHLSKPDNFLDFVLDSIVEGSARVDAQTWDRFSTVITIRKGSVPDHLQWEEQKTYDLVCHVQGCSVPMQIENSWRVGPAHIQTALSDLEFNVELDGVREIALREWCAARAQDLKAAKFSLSGDGITLSYDGIWLALAIAKSFTIKGNVSRVSIFERSLISDQDRCYTLGFRHPTKGLRLTLTLEGLPGWVVKQPTASAKAYNSGANVVEIRQPHLATASVDMPGWTLPGLAVVTEWAPT